MAVLRFELIVDGEIYPELYWLLKSLSDTSYQGERVRQLATVGAVWEKLRMENGSFKIGDPARLRAESPRVPPKDLSTVPVLRDVLEAADEKIGLRDRRAKAESAQPDIAQLAVDDQSATQEKQKRTEDLDGVASRMERMRKRGMFGD